MFIQLQNVYIFNNDNKIRCYVKLNSKVLKISTVSASTYLNKENKDKLNKFLRYD